MLADEDTLYFTTRSEDYVSELWSYKDGVETRLHSQRAVLTWGMYIIKVFNNKVFFNFELGYLNYQFSMDKYVLLL